MTNYLDHAAWRDALQAAGFAQDNGDRTLRHGGRLTAYLADDWLEFESDPAPRISADAVKPGLWKTLSLGDCVRRVAHLPRWVAGSENLFNDATAATPSRLIEWVISTSAGKIPVGWQPPRRDLVESWTPSGGLSLQIGGVICQGELVCDARWVVRFVVCSLPAAVASERRAIPKELLIPDAERLWRMVRFAWETDNAGHEVCRAEVDLSGAPHSENLFRAAYEACANAVRWLAPVAYLLAEPTLELRALELPPLCHVTNKTAKQNQRKDEP